VVKHRPWQPEVKNPPVFNPFESSTEWTKQLGDGDRIEIENEEDAEGSVPTAPATEKTGDTGSAALPSGPQVAAVKLVRTRPAVTQPPLDGSPNVSIGSPMPSDLR
jgi:hypothetical protein